MIFDFVSNVYFMMIEMVIVTFIFYFIYNWLFSPSKSFPISHIS